MTSTNASLLSANCAGIESKPAILMSSLGLRETYRTSNALVTPENPKDGLERSIRWKFLGANNKDLAILPSLL